MKLHLSMLFNPPPSVRVAKTDGRPRLLPFEKQSLYKKEIIAPLLPFRK